MTDHGDPEDGDLVEPAPETEIPVEVADAIRTATTLAAKACSTLPGVSPRPGANMPAAMARTRPRTSAGPLRKSAGTTRSCC